MKIIEYLKEKKEHRHSESFLSYRRRGDGRKEVQVFLASIILSGLFMFLTLANLIKYDTLVTYLIFLGFLAFSFLAGIYYFVFEYTAFLFTTDTTLVVWDNPFKRRSVEKKKIKKAFVFKDGHSYRSKLSNVLRFELKDGGFFDIQFASSEETKKGGGAMITISAVHCPYESEYEQKIYTGQKTELSAEEKEFLKKEKVKEYCLVLLVFVFYFVIFTCYVKYELFDSTTMKSFILAPVVICSIYFVVKRI